MLLNFNVQMVTGVLNMAYILNIVSPSYTLPKDLFSKLQRKALLKCFIQQWIWFRFSKIQTHNIRALLIKKLTIRL